MIGKRWLFLAHRWLGIVLSLVIALWFVSGMVMMYVGYPKLTRSERLEASPVIGSAPCCAEPAAFRSGLPNDASLKTLRLTMVGGQPRLIASAGKNSLIALDAVDGKPIRQVLEADVRSAVGAFAPDASVDGIERIGEDAFTHSKALDAHRPLYRVVLTHPFLARLYVSSVTGEVIRDVTVTESRWNWIGAWLHWLYPLRGGIFDAMWADIVIYSAVFSALLTLVGGVVGVMRWRRRLYPNGSHSPYRHWILRWHHLSGLIAAFLIFAWVVSGLFSMNPWKMFDSAARRPVDRLIEPSRFAREIDPKAALACFRKNSIEVRELEWARLGDELHVHARNGSDQVWSLRNPETCHITQDYGVDELLVEARRLMPQANMTTHLVLNNYDWNYYVRAPHTMTGTFERPLPVMLVKFDDADRTWLYIDMKSARVVQRSDDHARAKRWLFNFFHSYDWGMLLNHRPAWDLLLILGSLGGLLVSVTGVVMGWRRLCRAPPAVHK